MKKPKPTPTPSQLLKKAQAVEDSFKLSDYAETIGALRAKGMTFRAIAKWLSVELSRPVTHVQVFRVLSVETDDAGDPVEEHNARLSADFAAENENEAEERRKHHEHD